MTAQQERPVAPAAPVPPPPAPPAESGAVPPPPDRRRLPRLGRRSLTARIVSGVVALVVFLVCAIGAGTYLALESFLDSRLNQQVASAAAQNGDYFDRCLQESVPTPNGLQCDAGPLTQQEWVAAYVPSSGQYFTFRDSEFNHLNSLELSASERSTLVNDPDSILTVKTAGETLRVSARDTHIGAIVFTGLSTDDIDNTMRRLVILEIVIGGAAVIVAVLATTSGVQFSLRGLRRVTTTAQDVAAELSPDGAGLDRRVPVTEEGTEVAQLAESMNTLLEAVETQFAARIESEERMRQFLADASHELRTPLTSIRGYAELARMQRAMGEHADDNISRIESEGTRMSRLVEDLLLLARGDSNGSQPTADPELIDIDGLLDDAVSGARAAFPDRQIDVQVVESPHVVGDRDQLLRVVRNLVTNAAVHTAEGRPILARSRNDGTGVLIQIVDGGPGLPPDQAAHVFERFWRADKARTRARGGSGLGMSIVAAIVRSHGGAVYFESSVEDGSTVSVWLPGVSPV